MNKTPPNIHYHTPEVAVTDNRGLTIREIQYYRHPATPTMTEERITRHTFTDRGQAHTSADPRLGQSWVNNFTYLSTLSAQALLTTGVDNGTVLSLSDTAGRPQLAINATGVTRTWQYEDADSAGRPLAVTEQEDGDDTRITERFVYAGSDAATQALNLAGLCIRHYDTAGLQQTDNISLTGTPFSVTRRLLKDADTPETVADWQGADASAWDKRLAAESHTTLTTADATGAVLNTTDTAGNAQRVTYDVAGLLAGSWLTLPGGTERVIVQSLTYSAASQKLREEHGNGVVTTYRYEAETQRLTGIKTERPAGHASGVRVLQDLRYDYDPVGNVLSVRNDAEETRFWRNQKVVPENIYTYDSLYQLVSATGREMANTAQQGSGLPSVSSFDNATYTNYSRTYTYDTGGNLTQIRHSAPATGNSYTTDITVSNRSNRGVLSALTETPADVDALFTPGGQQKALQPGQQLAWTPRNELLQVTPVARDGGADDGESYRYDAGSQRILKVSTRKANNSVQTQRVLYLPGLELRTTRSGSAETESLQVIIVGEAGRAQVRMLHWEKGRPEGISSDPLHYSYDNLAGSSGLEVDAAGNIISQEEYYPYGGTAVLTARSQTEACYKTLRYSGKERDATGLYYYGYRYYQPWAGRWVSADPAGTVDGLNLFRMVRNNPATLQDTDGRMPPKKRLKVDIQPTLQDLLTSDESEAGSLSPAFTEHPYSPGNLMIGSPLAWPAVSSPAPVLSLPDELLDLPPIEVAQPPPDPLAAALDFLPADTADPAPFKPSSPSTAGPGSRAGDLLAQAIATASIPGVKSGEHTCLDCGKCFTQKRYLTEHRRIHTGEKPFACSYCDQRFASKSNLNKHKRVHTGERPFVCDWPGCDMRFTQQRHLKDHKLTHIGEKAFVCDWPGCDMRFAQQSNLTRHMLMHTGKPFVCHYADCYKSYPSQWSLTVHQKNKHK